MRSAPLAALALITAAALAQPAPTGRVRGSIDRIDATSVVRIATASR